MTFNQLLADLCAYALQSGMLCFAGLLLPRLVRYSKPTARITYYWLLLSIVVFFPLLGMSWVADMPKAGAVEAMETEFQVVETVVSVLPAAPISFSLIGILATLGLVSALRMLLLASGLMWLHGLVRKARLFESAEVIGAVQAWVGCKAEFFLSDRIGGPVTFGWKKPKVLLPHDFQSLPESQQRVIVCHELLHVQRRDWPVGLIEEMIRAMLWFHPAVGMLLNRIGLCREQAVDLDVVRLTRERGIYLEVLKNTAIRQGRLVYAGHGLMTKSHLVQRVAFLVKGTKISKTRLLAAFCGFLLVVVFVGVAAARMFPIYHLEKQQEDQASSMSTPAVFEPPSLDNNSKMLPLTDAAIEDPKVALPKPSHRARPKRTTQVTKGTKTKGLISGKPSDRPKSASRTDPAVAMLKDPTPKDPEAILPKSSQKMQPDQPTQPLQEAKAPKANFHASGEKPKNATRSVAAVTKDLGFVPPMPIRKVQPVFSKKIANAARPGIIRVKVLVGLEGNVEDAQILKTDDQRFVQPVLQAVRQWKYRPATRNGRPIRAPALIKFRFISNCEESVITGSRIPRGCRNY